MPQSPIFYIRKIVSNQTKQVYCNFLRSQLWYSCSLQKRLCVFSNFKLDYKILASRIFIEKFFLDKRCNDGRPRIWFEKILKSKLVRKTRKFILESLSIGRGCRFAPYRICCKFLWPLLVKPYGNLTRISIYFPLRRVAARIYECNLTLSPINLEFLFPKIKYLKGPKILLQLVRIFLHQLVGPKDARVILRWLFFIFLIALYFLFQEMFLDKSVKIFSLPKKTLHGTSCTAARTSQIKNSGHLFQSTDLLVSSSPLQ